MWELRFWDSPGSKIQKWLDKLPKDKLKSLAKEMLLLENCGNELKLPHCRALGKGLFELRERSFGLRVYYTFHRHKIIILLQAGEKRSQERDIKTAHKRLLLIGKQDEN